jgi:hypothetical protein
MKLGIALLSLAVLAVICLGGCPPQAASPPSAVSAPPVAPTTTAANPAKALTGQALGQQIFTTGNGTSGTHIAFQGGPDRFRTKPGGCIDCHGADGMGKTLGNNLKTPAICYDALRQPVGGKPALYPNDEALRQPITQGKDEKGEPLSSNMPRWQLSDTEFSGLLEYLKHLSESMPGNQGSK